MKIVSIQEIEGSEVVEVVARALYAHANFPGRAYDTVPWPPSKPTLMAYWNKAKAVVRAQHAFVAKREQERSEGPGPAPLTVGTAAAEATRDDRLGKLVLDLPQAAGAGCDLASLQKAACGGYAGRGNWDLKNKG